MSPAASALPNVRGGGMQEMMFAQRLADNDKKIRARALEKLKTFLTLKTANGPGITDDDALKIWKGLFYTMYNADKPLFQEDLADEVSKLIHEVENLKDAQTMTKAAFQTFSREWNGIDVFRIDKYMMFVRRVLRQVLVHLKLNDWDRKEVSAYVNIFNSTVIKPDDDTNITSLGLKLHFATILLEEIAKIGGEELDFKVLMLFISPYIEVMALSKLSRYRASVRDDIFYHLMRQSDLGVKFDGLPASAQETMMEVDNEEDEEETMEEIPIEEAVLDPRAGGVDVYIPQLKVNFGELVEALQKVGSLKKISKVHRKGVYSLIRQFKDMAEGVYPLAIPDHALQPVKWRTEKIEQAESALERLEEFYENLDKMPVEDLKKLVELEEDPCKPIQRSVSSRRQRNKRKKLNKLAKGKEKLSFSQRRKLVLQMAAATKNRKLAVKAAVRGITGSVGAASWETKESSEVVSPTKSNKRKAEAESGDSPKKVKKSKESNTAQVEDGDSPKKAKKSKKVNTAQAKDGEISKKGKKSKKTDVVQAKDGDIPRKLKKSKDTHITQAVDGDNSMKVKKSKSLVAEANGLPIRDDSVEKLNNSNTLRTLSPKATKTKKKKSKLSEEEDKLASKSTKAKKKNKVKTSEEEQTPGPEGPKCKRKKKKAAKQSDDGVIMSITKGETEVAKEKKEKLMKKSDSDSHILGVDFETETPKKKQKKTMNKESDLSLSATDKSSESLKVSSLEKVETTRELYPPTPGSEKTKKKKKKANQTEDLGSSHPSDNGAGITNEPSAKISNTVVPKNTKISTVETNTLVSEDITKLKNTFEVPEFSPSKTKTTKKKSKLGDSSSKLQGTPEVLSAKKKKEKKLLDSENAFGSPLAHKATMTKSLKKAKPLVLNLSEGKEKSVVSSKGPLKEQDIELFLKERREIKLAQRRASLSTPKGTPKTPRTMREKSIKINLKQNQEHEFTDYVNSVRNSPQIPFCADQTPRASVLKPSPSPILVGRKGLKILQNVVRKSASPALIKKSPKAKKLNRKKASDFF